ncbi:hypothetical protein SLS60_003626, partial [Paraconiothyrium brasiliense]
VFDDMGPWTTPLLEFHVVADPGDSASTSGDAVGQYAIQKTNPKELASVIKPWLKICMEQHSQCSKTLSGDLIATSTPLPTRCLEVKEHDTAVRKIRIRLVETASRTGDYMTLSHRWPAPPKVLQGATTSANLADRILGEDALESSLPRHFIDACIMTLRLGYEYIWIDAVCIIQGTDDAAARDWAYEAARMASYYQNSKFTIAATYGDDTIGLFHVEHSRPLIRLPYRARSSSMATWPSFFYLIPRDRYSNTDYVDHVARSDLLTRGWVFQEWILSRRILSYTPTGFYFQCMEGLPQNDDGRIETLRQYGQGKKGENDAYVAHSTKGLGLPELEFKLLNLSSPEARSWFDIVELFSQRDLTRPEKDNLMGLVGIAQEYGRILAGQSGLETTVWVGGLWRTYIRQGLLWEHVAHSASLPRPFLDRGDAERITEIPSWSWASRRSAVRWSRDLGWKSDHYCYYCEITSVRDIRTRQPEVAITTTPVTVNGDNEGWESLPVIGDNPGPGQARLVDPIKTFPVLCIQAPIISILLEETFTDADEQQTAAVLSDHDELGRWRKVALSKSPECICGWVSLDKEGNQSQTEGSHETRGGGGLAERHRIEDRVANDNESIGAVAGQTNQVYSMPFLVAPSQQQVGPGQESGNDDTIEDQREEIGQQAKYPGREVQVFLVAARSSDSGGYVLGYMALHHPVYHVICLRQYPRGSTATPSGFERIGVGRLFGRDVEQLFKKTELQNFQLF